MLARVRNLGLDTELNRLADCICYSAQVCNLGLNTELNRSADCIYVIQLRYVTLG